MLSGISDLPACEGSQCPSLKVFTLCVLSADFIPITARSFFIVLCSLVPTCTCVRSLTLTVKDFCLLLKENPESLSIPRGKINMFITMSTYPPGTCSIELKALRISVGYANATWPNTESCPHSLVSCCFSDIERLVIIVCLFSPGFKQCILTASFSTFRQSALHITLYISQQNCCQEKNRLKAYQRC